MAKGPKRAFFIRDSRTGTIATIWGHSRRGALAAYLLGRGVPAGVRFEVKPRADKDLPPAGETTDDEWEEFKTY